MLIAGLTHCERAKADCFTRSSIHLTQQIVDHGPTDYQRLVTPDPKGSKCVLRYRVHVKDDWETAEGVGYGKNENEACAQAMDLTRGSLLEELVPKKVRADTQMVCSDIPEIRVHPVRIGDLIWESEVDLHSHPQEQKYFTYKRTKCRMFVERDAKNINLFTYQGVICQADKASNSKWYVVDKY